MKTNALEEDKFKKRPARVASENENDTKFLDSDALDADLVDEEEIEDGVPSEIVKDDEWEAREAQNRH